VGEFSFEPDVNLKGPKKKIGNDTFYENNQCDYYRYQSNADTLGRYYSYKNMAYGNCAYSGDTFKIAWKKNTILHGDTLILIRTKIVTADSIYFILQGTGRTLYLVAPRHMVDSM